jgi:hypothetical protein
VAAVSRRPVFLSLSFFFKDYAITHRTGRKEKKMEGGRSREGV